MQLIFNLNREINLFITTKTRIVPKIRDLNYNHYFLHLSKIKKRSRLIKWISCLLLKLIHMNQFVSIQASDHNKRPEWKGIIVWDHCSIQLQKKRSAIIVNNKNQ